MKRYLSGTITDVDAYMASIRYNATCKRNRMVSRLKVFEI